MSTSGGPNIINNGLVLHLDTANTKSFRGIPTTNLLSNPTQILTTNEFGQYYNLAPIFDTNGLVPYSLSFDMKVNKNGSVLVYMQNGSWTKYSFVDQSVNATTEYQRFKFENITPSGPTAGWQANTPNDNRAMLATYTVYGSGVIPTLKNVQLELGSVSTPFVEGTRGTTVSTGGGWADRTSNQNHGELVNGVTYNSVNGGSLVFDGTNDYITMNYVGSGTMFTHEVFLKPTNVSKDQMYIGYNNYTAHYVRIVNSAAFLSVSTTVSQRTLAHTQTLLNNNVYHIVSTYDGVKLKIYVNNQLVEGTTLNETLNGWGVSRVGRWLDADQRSFVGDIYLFKSYNRALSAQEILQNYNAQKSRFGLP